MTCKQTGNGNTYNVKENQQFRVSFIVVDSTETSFRNCLSALAMLSADGSQSYIVSIFAYVFTFANEWLIKQNIQLEQMMLILHIAHVRIDNSIKSS